MTDLKNKIKRFAKGDFHIPQPEIIFPETHITMRVGEGEKYEGSFSLQNEGEGTIRGLVYPSSYRVQCVEQGFDGNPVNIYYTYDGRGLVPGHVEHGKFTIVCNGGEYDIAFTAIIEKPFVMTRYGKVQSLEDFKRIQPLTDRELQGKVGKRFFSDGKAGPFGFRGKIILAALRYFSRKPCLSGSVYRKALVVQRAAKARIFTIKIIKS